MVNAIQDLRDKGKPLNVLILEDREADAELMLHELQAAGFNPTWQRVDTESDFRLHLDPSLDIILVDYNLPQFTGLQAINIVDESDLGIPIIVVTSAIEENALECLKRGAADYLLKDRLGRLGPAVTKALEERWIREDSKLAIEALRASEQRYRGVAETALTGLAIVDTEERFTYTNPAFEKILGYSSKELLGMTLSQTVKPDEITTIRTQMDHRKQGISAQYEVIVQRKDGKTRTIIVSGSPLTSEDGKYEGSQAVITDITERVQAENNLVESEEKLRLMVDNSPIGFCATDMKGNFIDVNPAICLMLGYSNKELIAKHFNQISHPGDKENNQEMYQKLVEGEIEYFDLEKRYIHKSGKSVHVQIRAQLARNYEGEPLFEFSIVENITAKVRAEKLLKVLNQAALSMAQALTPNEIFTAIGETLKELDYDCIILTMDESRTRLNIKHTSYSSRALQAAEKNVGLKQKKFSFPVKNVDVYSDVILNRKTIYIENSEEVMKQVIPAPAKRFAGQLVRMFDMSLAIATPLIVNDEIVGILSVQANDLIESDGLSIATFAHQVGAALRKAQLYEQAQREFTERMRAEEERRQMEMHLRQQQKLESIGTLASGVAHEINNPITGIMNYAQLIHDRLDPSEVRLREFSAGIVQETKRVTEIVGNLLTFSRQDKTIHDLARIDKIIKDTLSLIRAVFLGDQITLEVDLPEDLPQIKCRSQQIQQVLMNLLTNARDALNERYPSHNPDKIVCVSVRSIEKEGQRWLRTTVEDHGAGIPAEIRERIFDPFYTTKDRTLGTGLGLSISLGIVQDHRGELTFESEENQPTRFYLDLPVDDKRVIEK